WPAFPDSAAALAGLHERFKLGVITNCDDDLFAASQQRLDIECDYLVTAQQAKRYKPNPRGFELMFERVGLPPSRILHVAQSLFHDHVTPKRLPPPTPPGARHRARAAALARLGRRARRSRGLRRDTAGGGHPEPARPRHGDARGPGGPRM